MRRDTMGDVQGGASDAVDVTVDLSPRRVRLARWLLTRRGLLISFAVLHLVAFLALLPAIIAGGALGDLWLYREWAIEGGEGRIVGIDEDWVYPLLAWLPIGTANLFGPALFQLVWFILTAALNFWAIWTLSDGAKSRSGILAAHVWLLGFLLLSPVALLRLEGITGPLAIVGLVWLARRPALAGALLAIATWIKVWPAMLVGLALALHRERWRVLVAGVVVSLCAVAASAALGGLPQLLSFLEAQEDRGLQLEATLATPWVWLAALHVPGSRVFQNHILATREVVGPLDDLAVELSTPLLVVAVVALGALIARAALRRASARELFLVGAFALVAALIVCNKVGSPQYLLWLLPVAAVAMRSPSRWWRTMTGAMLVTAFLTTLVFPVFYMPLVRLDVFAVLLLTARNAMLVAMLIAAAMRLVRLGSPSGAVTQRRRAASLAAR